MATATPYVAVLLGLEVTVEGAVKNLDLGEPFHRCHPIPAGHHEPQRIAVLVRQRRTVHLVGQQSARTSDVTQAEAAFESDRFTAPVDVSAVRATEQHLPRRGCQLCAIEDVYEPNAGPLRGT